MASEKESLQVLENLFDSGKFDDVIKSSDEFLKEFPSSFHIGFIRCKALLKSGKKEEAETGIDTLLTIFPENINLLVEKGFLLFDKRRSSEAREFFEKALFLDPFNERAKRGIEDVKKIESGEIDPENNPMSFISYERKKATLEDTISESDLEKLMEIKNPKKTNEFSGEDSSPNVSISFEDSSIQKRDEILLKIEEKESQKDPESNHINVEAALDELNKLTDSDVKALKLDEPEMEQVPESEDSEEEAGETESSFTTESAAILYLKQGLYKDAENIFIKLYKQENPSLFQKKLDMMGRVKILQAKVTALNNLMISMKNTGETIV